MLRPTYANAKPPPQPMPRDAHLSVSLPTLLGVAPLLGGALEDRSTIRDNQDPRIVDHALTCSHREVNPAVLQGFCVAPLDFLVTGTPRSQRVGLIELNGSGMGGLVCADILGREGYSVCILEKNKQAGGSLQTYVRDRVIFDSGVHYLGGLGEGQNLYQVFKYLGAF